MDKKNFKYSPALRKFCLRIYFHSASAYRELRQYFGNRLPTIRVMQMWLLSVDASPGITGEALNAISERAKIYRDQGKQLQICLVSDEVSIRKQILWDETKKSFEGYYYYHLFDTLHYFDFNFT